MISLVVEIPMERRRPKEEKKNNTPMKIAVFHFIQVPDSHPFSGVLYWGTTFTFDEHTAKKQSPDLWNRNLSLGNEHFERMRNDLVNNLHLIDCCATSNKIYCRAWLMFRFKA